MAEENQNPDPNATPNPDPAAAFDWGKAGLDADTLGYVQTKGFAKPADVLYSYRNLEKLQGVPEDRLVRMPAPDAKPEDVAAYHVRLGAGKAPTDYKLTIPEGADPKFAETAASWFHKNGVSVKAAQEISKDWNAYATEIVKAQDAEYQTKVAAEQTSLKSEWGAKHDELMATAKKAAGVFGVKPEEMTALEKSIGYGGVMKLFANIGAKMGESAFAGDGSSKQTFGVTPEQAVHQIGELKKDADFVRRYTNGDMEAKQRMEQLHSIAYGA